MSLNNSKLHEITDVIFSSSFTEGTRSWAVKIIGTQYNYRKCNGRLITNQCQFNDILFIFTWMFYNIASPYLLTHRYNIINVTGWDALVKDRYSGEA